MNCPFCKIDIISIDNLQYICSNNKCGRYRTFIGFYERFKSNKYIIYYYSSEKYYLVSPVKNAFRESAKILTITIKQNFLSEEDVDRFAEKILLLS